MSNQNDSALQPYRPRALQRKVERHEELMRAKGEVAKAAVEAGTELHNRVSASMIEAAQFDHFMLQAASQNLNGTYAAVEEAIRLLAEEHRRYLTECARQQMVSFLKQAEGLPVHPDAGAVARLGDGIAALVDEYHRLRAGE